MSLPDPNSPTDKRAGCAPRVDPGIDDISRADAAATAASGKPELSGDWRLALERIVERGMPHTRALNMRMDRLEPGCVTISMPYDVRLAGDRETGILHSGAVMALIDTAVGMASFSALQAQRPIATLDLRIDYLRPTSPGERLIADAERVHASRGVLFMRALAHHGDPSRPVAAGASTFMVGSTGFAPLSGGDGG